MESSNSNREEFNESLEAWTKENITFFKSHARKRKCQMCKNKSNFVQCELPCIGKPKIRRSKRIKLNESKNSDNFISQKENINEMDEYGRTILHTAVVQCDAQLVKELIRQGADPFVRTKANLSILWFAVKAGCVHTIEVLIDHGCAFDENSLTPYLIMAIRSKHYHMIKFLVHNGANVNGPMMEENKWVLPLHLVCRQTNRKVVQFLLDHGASVDAVDKYEETALFKVTRAIFPNLIPILLKYGANIHHKTSKNLDVLHVAVQNCSYTPKTLLSLVRGGADVNVENNLKETPLHEAARQNCPESRHGRVPIIFRSWQYEFFNVCDVHLHSRNAVELLLNLKAKVDVKNKRNETPLHLAVENGCPYVVQQLIDAGAAVDAEGEWGFTPLKIAAEYEFPCVVRQLLVAGADLRFFATENYASCLTTEVNHAFTEFFIARRAAGFNVVEKALCNVNIDSELKLYEQKCLEEVEYMRTVTIALDKDDEKSKMTLFNFLRASRRRLALVSVKCKNFLDFIGEKNFNKLPIYRDMLEFKFVDNLIYAPFLDKVTKKLNEIFRFQLPEIVLDTIVCKLDVDTLNKITEADENSNTSK